MPSSEDSLADRVMAELGVRARPAVSIARSLEADRFEVGRILDELVVSGRAEKVGVLYREAPVSSPAPVSASGMGDGVPPADAPEGVERLRAILRFHADVQEELASSAFAFDPKDDDDKEALKQSMGAPVDWHALDTQQEVRVLRRDLPARSRVFKKGSRHYFCGPLELVETSKRGPSKRRWIPIFILPVRAHPEQSHVRFVRDGDVRLNLKWLDAQSRDLDEKVDLQVRLGLLEHTDEPTEPRSLKVRNLGRCWSALFSDVELMEETADQVREKIREKKGPLDPPTAGPLPLNGSLGIYGRALLVKEELNSFSKGLVEDLRAIAEKPEGELMRSALAMLVGPEHAASRVGGLGSGPQIHEAPLNESQQRAVHGAMVDPITVVQGPPGTGKSTTVRAAMLTVAAHRGSVLFSSTNHKAVDAVTEEWNRAFQDGRKLVADLRRLDGPTPKWTSVFLQNLASARDEDEELEPLLSELSAIYDRESELERDIAEAVELREQLADAMTRMHELRQSDQPEMLELAESWPGSMSVAQCQQLLRGGQLSRWNPRRWWSVWGRRRLLASLQAAANRSDPLSLADALIAVEYRQAMQDLRKMEDEGRASVDVDRLNQELVDCQDRRLTMLADLMPKLPGLFVGRARSVEQGVKLIHSETRSANRVLLESQYVPKALLGLPLWAITTKSVKRAIPCVACAFDLAIIDEAAQCDVSSVLPVLFRARRAMFVGDENQLSAMSSEQIAVAAEDVVAARHKLASADLRPFLFRGKSAYSLGNHLLCSDSSDNDSGVVLLDEHYRCHPEIAEFFSRACYDDQLVIRTSRDGATSADGRGIRWSHVTGERHVGLQGGSRWDPLQKDRIVEALKRLDAEGFEGTVGVVTPFRGHAKRIQDEVERQFPRERLDKWDFLANTVDKFQGGERDIILVGLVGGGAAHTPPFYKGKGAKRRFNVAFSRAKQLLHIFGDKEWAALSGVPILEDLVEHVREVEETRVREVKDPVRRELIGPVWEPALADAMRSRGLKFEQQHHACGFYLDFALFPGGGRKINVEVDGEQWHKDRNGRRKRSDVKRDRILRRQGWTVCRFWVYELREDMDGCVDQIARLLSESS